MATAQPKPGTASGWKPHPVLEKPKLEMRAESQCGSFMIARPFEDLLSTLHGDKAIIRVDSDNGSTKDVDFTNRGHHKVLNALIPQGDDVMIVSEYGTVFQHPMKDLCKSKGHWSGVVKDPHGLIHAAALSPDLLVFIDKKDVFTCRLNPGSYKCMDKEVKLKNACLESDKVGFTGQSAKVACTGTGDDARIAIVEPQRNIVTVYDANWKIQKLIGRGDVPELKRPHACLFLPWGNVLVADTNNDRVSEYSFAAKRVDGQLVRHWVTADQGVYQPKTMAFAHPDLWVSHYDKKDSLNRLISRFKIFLY